jgi:hypothetical protein
MCGSGSSGTQGLSESHTAQAEAWVADIGLGLGVVAIGVGTYLVLTAPKPAKQGLLVVPVLGPDRAGLALSSSW